MFGGVYLSYLSDSKQTLSLSLLFRFYLFMLVVMLYCQPIVLIAASVMASTQHKLEMDNRVYQEYKNLFQRKIINVKILGVSTKSSTEEHGVLRCSKKMQASL